MYSTQFVWGSAPTHSHGMNERADRLAAQGAQGMRSRGGGIYVPADGGGRAHRSGVYAPPGAGRVTC